MRNIETEMLRLADEALRGFFTDVPAPNKFWQPRVDVHETSSALVIKAELAGVQPDSLQVTLSADRRALLIAGDRVESAEERVARIRCYQLEVFFGAFEREVILPSGVAIEPDTIEAKYRDGMLLITLPKAGPQSGERRNIPVDITGSGVSHGE